MPLAATSHDSPMSLPVFVARQAIYDKDMRVAGYELLFRSCDQNMADIQDQSGATATVIANGMALVARHLGNKPAFINFPEKLLLEEAPLAVHPESCVIEILESVTPSAALLQKLKSYKDQGYTLALDDYVGQPQLTPILELAEIIKVEIMGRSTAEIIKLAQKLRQTGRKLLAEKIEDRETFELVLALGFDYFQGYYFSKPVVEAGVSLKTSTVAKLRVLSEISSEEYNVNKVAKMISQDAGLSYRLLSHLNTPHFSFKGKVNSLVQAVTLMGGKPLKQWLMLVMLADMGKGSRHNELLHNSVCRGSFLEQLSETKPFPPYSPDTFFLMGLFSNLDALLDQPMNEITPHLPFDQTVTDALLGKKSKIRDYIELSILLEQGCWRQCAALLQALGIQEEFAAQLHARAAEWSYKMLDFKKEKEPSN